MRRVKTSRCGAWSVAHTQLALAAVITAWERNAGEEMACVCLLIWGMERKASMCTCLCLEICGKGWVGGCPGAPNSTNPLASKLPSVKLSKTEGVYPVF